SPIPSPATLSCLTTRGADVAFGWSQKSAELERPMLGCRRTRVSIPVMAERTSEHGLAAPIERLSIELTNRCGKACWFCYNHSQPGGGTRWTPDELVAFAADCASHGVKS